MSARPRSNRYLALLLAPAIAVAGSPRIFLDRAAEIVQSASLVVKALSPAQAPLPDPAQHVHDGVAGHEASEGFLLEASPDRRRGGPFPRCVTGVRVREYDVVALNVDISLNRYLDHDPEGRMFALAEDVDRVRAEEDQNATARGGLAGAAVSMGLQGDAIQPLTLRVQPGECLRLSLRNDLRNGERAGLNIHGAGLVIASTGAPALASVSGTLVAPGRSVTYEWMVPATEPEATHYFHSPGDDRDQTSHGLFGALIVEPAGATWFDPLTGRELRSGWAAVIREPSGRSFREAVLYYHEVGNELYQLLDRNGQFVPLVDPLTTAYRPGARALNYRSEPFMNRLQLQASLIGEFFDESVAYGSYTFGDPATPMLRSYLGDPMKQRIVHGGSEVFHVHHVHGGSIRWRRQPGTEPTDFNSGLQKQPPLVPSASERIDSQSIGPAETYDVENECGSGGCQQSVGDYLIHCHVAHHYFAGMWTLWRVYNTKQDGQVSTDALPPLLELPDRGGRILPAVRSDALIGRAVDWSGKSFTISAADFTSWIERQLPPSGTPRGYDASVFDWQRAGDVYFGEPEDIHAWPGYRSATPGTRQPIWFDPATGKLAFPFLRPHLGRRPPFAPNHGPAPYLDPIASGTDPPAPGANGPASVCPAGTRVRSFAVDAVDAAVPLNARENLVDPAGQLFVLRDQQSAIRRDPALRQPLTLRANAREDCVDIVLRSELADTVENHNFSKVNLHIHLVQFDIQASDGVIAGFNYEQSVRPYGVEGEKISAGAAAGEREVHLASATHFQPGVVIGVGMDRDETFEVSRIAAVDGSVLRLEDALRFAHDANEIVSTEFVRYRWYPDVQFGTAYFHDHVNAISTWRHGLFGALVVEPPGSTYHDPHDGREVKTGAIVDIHTSGSVSVDVRGSFREVALFLQDDVPITHLGRSSGSAVSLRSEPLAARGGAASDLFSSVSHGDPATPVVEAYLGDPVVVRLLVAASNGMHTWHLDGHTFRLEPYSATSPPVSTVHLGISERYELSIPAAGGPQRLPGDYLYYSGQSSHLREGSWGIFRVHASDTLLRKLPGHEHTPTPAETVCPADTPSKHFAVGALEVPLPMLAGQKGRVYALAHDRDALLSGTKPADPLVLHVNVGDCVVVDLANELSDDAVTFHAPGLAYDPRAAGPPAGRNGAPPVPPGGTGSFTYYAHPDVGETVALIRDWGDVEQNPRLGLYGAIVVGPRGSRYTDPRTGEDVSLRSAWAVDVHPPGAAAYRDFSLFLEDEDAGIGTHRMPYTVDIEGVVAMNYRLAPLAQRGEREPGGEILSVAQGAPATPLLEAIADDAVRIHVLLPWNEQAHVFAVEDHRWPLEHGRDGTDLLGAMQVSGLEAVTLRLVGGAGAGLGLSGDFVYGDRRLPYRDAGMWGMFRVYAPCAQGAPRALGEARCGVQLDPVLWIGLGGAVVMLGVAVVATRRLRRVIRER